MSEQGTRRPARPIVGVVPNFSEGRRREVIDEIVGALQVPGVLLVNVQWDAEHNRLDTTLLGTPEAVRASALAGAAVAVRLIDMTRHHGGHPRMGAVDVIPFMPVRDVTMDECVALARAVGRELAESLDLPVYLYDRAALVPERQSLAVVRKGEYEGLREAVAGGERLPDLGPREIGRAGAVPSGRASRSSRSTSTSRVATRPRPRRSRGPFASPPAGSRPSGPSASTCRSANVSPCP